MNVLLAPSRGEGFGLPLIEAQACEVPVITTDFGAMAEVGAVGWRVEGQRTYSPVSAWYVVPSIDEISGALEDAYEAAEGLRGQARQQALSYDADLVANTYLVPALEAVSAKALSACWAERAGSASMI